MAVAIPIVLVMYFFLLPARFEGGRYAPTRSEKWAVIAGLGLAMAVVPFFFGGTWFGFFLGLLPIYAILLPARMILRTKVHPIEAWIVIFSIFVAMVVCLILPLFISQ